MTRLLDHAVFVDTSNADDIRLVQPIPQTKKQKRVLLKYTGVQHFKLQERMGLNPLFHCWCGASLELDYIAHGYEAMAHTLMCWCDTHNECPAPEAQSA